MSTDLLPLVPPQQRRGGVFDYLSPSRLNLWMRCPLAFAFRYIEGLSTPASPALFVGKQVHWGLEQHYRHRMLGVTLEPGEILARMNATWEQAVAAEGVAFDSTADEAGARKQTSDLVAAYLAQIPSNEPRPLAVEATMEVPLVDPFTGEDQGIPLLGIVDLVLDGSNGAEVVDFKTSSRSAPPFEVTHEVQLTSYGWLFRETTGMDAARLEIRSIIKTKTPKIEAHHYPARTDAHLRRLFAVVHEYLDCLHSERFNYRPGWGCAMCDFRDGPCRAWPG